MTKVVPKKVILINMLHQSKKERSQMFMTLVIKNQNVIHAPQVLKIHICNLKRHIVYVHENKDLECDKCSSKFRNNFLMKNHTENINVTQDKNFKCETCGSNFGIIFAKEKKVTKPLIIGSFNICRGLFKKEELLINTIQEQHFDIFAVSEVDIENMDEERPFTIEG